MSTVLYTRSVSESGRRTYHEWGHAYDSDALPFGWHLVGVLHGERTTRYGVDPARAALLAALREQKEAVGRAIFAALQGRPVVDSERARDAYRAYRAAGGCDDDVWSHASVGEIITALERALVEVKP